MTALENKDIERLADNLTLSQHGTKHALITSAQTLYLPELNPYTALWNLTTRDTSRQTEEMFILDIIKTAYPEKYKELDFWDHRYDHGMTKPQMALTLRLAELHQDVTTSTVKPTINHRRLEFAILLQAFVFDLINHNTYHTTHETIFKITTSTLKTIYRKLNDYITNTHNSEPANFHRLSATVFYMHYNEQHSELWESNHKSYTPTICPNDNHIVAMKYIMPVFTDAVRSFSKNFVVVISSQEEKHNTSLFQKKIDNYIAAQKVKLQQKSKQFFIEQERQKKQQAIENEKRQQREKEMAAQFDEIDVKLPADWTTASDDDIKKAIWTAPMSKIGAIWGVSNTTIRKTCIHRNIPRPNRAFWAALKKGIAPPGVPTKAYIQ